MKDNDHIHPYKEAKPRIPNHRIKVLEALRNAGSSGVTNIDLIKIGGSSYTTRLSELYIRGYDISKTLIGDGVWKYVLINEPEKENLKPKKAIDLFTEKLMNEFGEDIAKRVSLIIEEEGFTIKRKMGFWKAC